MKGIKDCTTKFANSFMTLQSSINIGWINVLENLKINKILIVKIFLGLMLKKLLVTVHSNTMVQ